MLIGLSCFGKEALGLVANSRYVSIIDGLTGISGKALYRLVRIRDQGLHFTANFRNIGIVDSLIRRSKELRNQIPDPSVSTCSNLARIASIDCFIVVRSPGAEDT